MPSPDELRGLESTLVRVGWPTRGSRVEDQHLAPIVNPAIVRRFAPDEDALVLLPPPFQTVADDAVQNPKHWTEFGAVDEIDPEEAVLIADFGLGSDTVIIADFRSSPAHFFRLVGAAEGNHWVSVADTVDELSTLLAMSRE